MGNPDFYVTALIARWRAATATLTWVNCGHPPPYLIDPRRRPRRARSAKPSSAGNRRGQRSFDAAQRRLLSGERLILLTDGILERRTEDGGRFGVDGLRRALEHVENPTAASTAMTITRAVTDCWTEPLEDDATVVAMAIA